MIKLGELNITGLAIDSRKVKPGYLFFAYKGTHHDGRNFIEDAIANGALVVMQEGESEKTVLHDNIHFITVPNIREKIVKLAADFYGHPTESLKMIGVTGTNGKTSVSHFIAASLDQCGIIGTLGSGFYGDLEDTGLTTPDTISLQAILADLVKHGAKAVAMEVSSHSLDQGRVAGIEFDVGIFTNLTRDHLDYHGTMEAYAAAKQKLFDQSHHAVINADDDFGKTLLSRPNVLSYSVEKNADIFAKNISLELSGIYTEINSPWGKGEVHIPLIGRFNLSNALAVFTTLNLLEIPFEQTLLALSRLRPVAGRMDFHSNKEKIVIVDYAHTPDALEKVLIALRKHCKGRLLCLFGCGGDRDKGKRPIMAQIAEKYSDQVLVTDDNPRTEDPGQIVQDILQGFKDASRVIVQHNRSKAIEDIIQYAKAGDCVLIAGKGAETYQQVGEERIPFSDLERVREVL